MSDRRGFTILELVIAVVILAIALFPFLLAMRGSGRSVRGTRDYSWAIFVAQQTLEELRSVPYRQLADTVQAINDNSYGTQVVELQNGDYERQIEMATCAVPAMTTLRIVVEWDNEKGDRLHFESTAMITEAMQP